MKTCKIILCFSILYTLICCSGEKHPSRPLDFQDDQVYEVVIDSLYFNMWKNSDKQQIVFCLIDSTQNYVFPFRKVIMNIDSLPEPITAFDSLNYDWFVQNQQRHSIGDRISKIRESKIFPVGSSHFDLNKKKGEMAIVSMSRIGFYDKNALLYYEYTVQGLWASGMMVLLEKRNSTWQIVEINGIWES